MPSTSPDTQHTRRVAILGASAALLSACATTADTKDAQPNTVVKHNPNEISQSQVYDDNELIVGISNHLGVTSEAAASAIERTFRERGRPTAYVTGEEGGGAFIGGARYGKGTLWMKNGESRKIYWQGPSVGFDVGVDASKVFTLVYNLNDMDDIFRRYPGVDGSAFLVAGMAIHYQRANNITLAPIRTGVGARLGVNVGYTSYTKRRSIIPL